MSVQAPQPQPDNTVLRLREASKIYPGPPPITALHATSIEVTAGEFVTVMGPSGSGKSTLLNLLGLLDRPTEGAIEIDGQRVDELSEGDRAGMRAETIGFVFQSFHLIDHLSAAENVALGLLYRGVRNRQRLDAAREVLGQVDLAERADALPTQLSGGQRQRVAIARALVGQPRLLLCDEPTGNLDSHSADVVLSCVQRLNADGQTIVLITHDPSVAARGSRTMTMRDGVLAEAGPRRPDP